MTLGLTNGTTNVGLLGGGSYVIYNRSSNYGQNVGFNNNITTPAISNNTSLGVTTDTSKSGLKVNISNSIVKTTIIKY